MKKIILIVFILTGLNSRAQNVSDYYSFSYAPAYYEFLQGPTTRICYAWGNGSCAGYMFNFCPTPLGAHRLRISTDGSFELQNDSEWPYYEVQNYFTQLMGGLCDRGIYDPSKPSEILYQTDTLNPGNKICKVEFRNMGFILGTAANVMNFQIWFYQKGHIEYRFGPQYLAGLKSHFIIGIDLRIHAGDSYMYLDGDPSMPNISGKQRNEMNGPMSNQDLKYRFEWKPNALTGMDQVHTSSLSIYPVPALDFINVDADVELQKVLLYDLTGRKYEVKKDRVSAEKIRLDLSSLLPGVYLIEIQSREGILRKKVIKV